MTFLAPPSLGVDRIRSFSVLFNVFCIFIDEHASLLDVLRFIYPSLSPLFELKPSVMVFATGADGIEVMMLYLPLVRSNSGRSVSIPLS